ncbi:MAG TPA: hypothetical protein VNO30_00280 [Kofleriaceae bacterium]|nr:hypothetical protein [Kofleriaceae bacterium]
MKSPLPEILPSPRARAAASFAAAFAAVAAAVALPASAAANPRPLPFSYPYETLPGESLEVEQYVDLVPVRVVRELPDGTTEGVVSVRSQLQTELEYGLTDRLEVALYFAFRQGGSATVPFLRFEGLKQRLRYRFAEQGEWPVDVGVYLELAEYHNELEFEEKLLFSRRFGPVAVVANLWVEQEWYFQTQETKYIYNPTVGVAYEISPRLSLGAEYWVRGRFDKDAAAAPADMDETSDTPRAAAHYAGPTLLLQSKKIWVSVGAYARLDRLASGVAVGDPYGKVWIRTVLGIDL